MSYNHLQTKVLTNVANRGYLDGWTIEQFLLRQLVKLVEEVCELYLSVQWNNTSIQHRRLRELVTVTREQARLVFDDKSLWTKRDIEPVELAAIKSETADVVVVACCIAGAVRELTGEYFPLMQAAAEKSNGDIKRGVRQ